MDSIATYITSLISSLMLLAAAPFAAPALDASKFSDTTFTGGIVPVTAAHHSLGSAADATGKLYFTEYNKARVMRYDAASGSATTLLQNVPGAYALTIAPDGTKYIATDSDNKTGTLRAITPQGASKDVLTGLTKPRGITIGSDGNVYVALESENKLIRYNTQTGKGEDVLTGAQAPQGVVELQGQLYWVEGGSFGKFGEPLSAGKLRVKDNTTGVTRTLVDGIWHARGLFVTKDGLLLGASEANKSGQGNSGYLFSYNPTTNELKQLIGGLDYPQTPFMASDSLYTTLARDNVLVMLAAPTARTWPHVSESALYEGSVVEGESTADPVFIAIEGATLPVSGEIVGGAGGAVRAWLTLSTSEVSISKKELPHGTPDVPTGGVFPVPITSCKRDSGASCTVTIIPQRKRVNDRWPLWYDEKKREWPQKKFDEAPIAYWFYVDSQPQKESLSRSWSQMAPSLQRLLQRHFEGLLHRKPNSFEEMANWLGLVHTNDQHCKDISNAFLGSDEWKKITTGQTDEQIVKSLYQGLFGVDADASGLSYALKLRKQGEPWDRVTSDLMRTELYNSVCSKDWY